MTDAESLGLQSLESEPRLGGPPIWLSRNVVALLRAASSHFEEAEVLLDEMTELTAVSGDPMPRAVSLFDRALLASFSPNPVEGLEWAEELVSLGDAWGSACLQAMGLVSVGRALAIENGDRARSALTEAVTLAETSRCGLLVDQAKRVLSEIDALAGVHERRIPRPGGPPPVRPLRRSVAAAADCRQCAGSSGDRRCLRGGDSPCVER